MTSVISNNGKPCLFDFTVNIPSCTNTGGSNKIISHDFKNIKVSLAPNPAREQVTISHKDLNNNATVELFDLTGKLITNVAVQKNGDTTTINTNQYPNGIYLVVVKTNGAIISQQKLIIE